MDLHYKQATAVGGMVLVAAVAFVAGTIWLQGRSFGSGNLYTAKFVNIGSLKRGSAVRVSGVDVGNVERIDFRGVGDVAVRLNLSNPDVMPREDATASITSIGLIGDVVLDYFPGSSTTPLADGGEIPGSLTGGLTDLGSGLMSRVEALMDSMAILFTTQLSNDLHQTLEASQTMFRVLADTVNGPLAELTRTLVSMRSLGVRADSLLGSDEFRATITNLDSTAVGLKGMTRQLTTVAARMDTLLINMSSGKGTLGKLVTDTTLYNGLLETQRSVQALIDTLTAHPGKLNIKVELF
jgi:phospholipid/cholesterol/gamma-HCH transport system substrate-binding protein